MQPLSALHVSVVHALPSLQLSGAPGAQTPAWHVSAPLHTVASSQDVPFGSAGCWQPSVGLQESVVHGFESSQLSATPAVQTPAWQVSLPLHTVASAHDVLFGSALCEQPVMALQASAVQGLPSSQLSGVPGWQTPLTHVSAPLHTVVSAHDVPSNTGLCWHPVSALHVSLVHGLPSSQLGPVPGVQMPP